MATINSALVKQLRDKTGAGMMDCKKALEETSGDMDAAIEVLRKKGAATAAKRADKETNQGVVEAYIHAGGRIGAMVELNCETDFVAKTPGFKSLAHDIAMQIAAMSPQYVVRDQVDVKSVEKESEIYKSQAKNEGKPANIAEKIAQGRLEKFFMERCLADQLFIRDPEGKQKVRDLLKAAEKTLGEPVSVAGFARFRLGEGIEKRAEG